MLDSAAARVSREIDAWNGVLNQELLDGRFEAQPLYLCLEPERLDQLGVIFGKPLEVARKTARCVNRANDVPGDMDEGVSCRHPSAPLRWPRLVQHGP